MKLADSHTDCCVFLDGFSDVGRLMSTSATPMSHSLQDFASLILHSWNCLLHVPFPDGGCETLVLLL